MPVLDFSTQQLLKLVKHLQELEDLENKQSEMCKELYPLNVLKFFPSGKWKIEQYKDGRIILKEEGKIDFHPGIRE